MPGAGEVVYGGAVKFALLHRELPNAPRDFNVLYLGSSWLPLEAQILVRLLRRRAGAFVWNQNGVAYPGWYGEGWELVNEPRARLLHAADHVVYQTEFCKRSADRFYGAPSGSWEILPNPVDTAAFSPAPGAARPPADAAPRRQPVPGLPAGARPRHARARAGGAAGGAPRRRGGADLRRRRRPGGGRLAEGARARRRRRVRRPLHAGAGARARPPRRRAPAHEGERPLPDDRPRGDGLRAAGRLRGERRRPRARRAGRGRRRSHRGGLGARRAPGRRRAGPGRPRRPRRPRGDGGRRPRSGRSSATTPARGSRGTGRSSRSCVAAAGGGNAGAAGYPDQS